MKLVHIPKWRALSRSVGSASRPILVGGLALLGAVFFLASPVYAALGIFPTSLPDAEVGESYSATLLATGGTAPYTWSIDAGALPGGLNLGSTSGTISGTPSTAGSYSFLVKVTDNTSATATQPYTIDVSGHPVTFSTTTLPGGTEGTSYHQTITVTGGTSPYNWELSSGTLPPGLTLNSNTGVISGTPEEDSAGTYNFTITVTDDSTPELSSERAFSIVIAQGAFKSTISIGTGLLAGQTRVLVDGEPVAFLRGGESVHLDFDLGDVLTVSVDPVVSDPARANVRFTAQDTSQTVSDDSPNAIFDYDVEYQIDLRSDPAQATPIAGSDWYGQGDILRIYAPTPINNTQDTEYRFSHWVLTGGETISENDFSLAVTAPGTIIAIYDTYYQLTFKTEPSGIAQMTGSGWYKAGYALRTSAPADVDGTPGTQYRFSRWVLPTGETASDRDLSLAVNAPGTVTASYDTYYQLSLKSAYGDVGGGTWYKAGSLAQWSIDSQEIPMSGIMGALGGKRQAINTSGTEVMDGPKSVNINWNSDYARPILAISLIALAIGLAVFFALRRRRYPPPAPVMAAPPPQALPPPQTTVVMIGDAARSSPQTTKEQLLDKFSQLLDKYEQEVRVSVETPKPQELGKGQGDAESARALPEGLIPQPSVVEGESTLEPEGSGCDFTGKRLMRVVAGPWRQAETKTTALSPGDGIGLAVVWARDTFNEWRILECSLPYGHRGIHQGNLRLEYTLLNTVTEEQVYGIGEKVTPPSPHFTDGMPAVEVTADQVVRYEQLPTENLP